MLQELSARPSPRRHLTLDLDRRPVIEFDGPGCEESVHVAFPSSTAAAKTALVAENLGNLQKCLPRPVQRAGQVLPSHVHTLLWLPDSDPDLFCLERCSHLGLGLRFLL